jgi:uncharacterized protein YecE (DUF72 family)
MLRIGTSGWIYKHWKGLFYPDRLPQRQWLDFYAQHFDTVEINFSFYRLPTREAFESWRDRAAPGFCYAVKGSRFITHIKRLAEPQEHVGLFSERLRGLGDRAGPILWQLPPTFTRDDQRLHAFLEALPAEYQHTIEFRHESWLVDAVFDCLSERHVALCIPDSPNLPKALLLTADWSYVRFHYGSLGGDYTDAELDTWAQRLQAFLERGVAVWVYYNNDWNGYAIKNAKGLRERLAIYASVPSPDREVHRHAW